jgi:hypothetical protein
VNRVRLPARQESLLTSRCAAHAVLEHVYPEVVMFKPRLAFAIALVVPLVLAEAEPASAQTSAGVTLTTVRGTTNTGALTGSLWSPRGQLILEGKKSNGTTFRCLLKSTDHQLLLSIQERLMEAKTATTATCTAPSTQTTTEVVVDFANQTSTNTFTIRLLR